MGYSLAGAALLGLAGLDVCFSFVPAATFRPELASSLRFSQESNTSSKGRGTNWGERRRGAAAAVGPVRATKKSKEEQESDVFDWLASNAGVDKIVSLGTVAGGGYRGLVMNSDVEEGQVRCTHVSTYTSNATLLPLRAGKVLNSNSLPVHPRQVVVVYLA